MKEKNRTSLISKEKNFDSNTVSYCYKTNTYTSRKLIKTPFVPTYTLKTVELPNDPLAAVNCDGNVCQTVVNQRLWKC